MIRGSPGASGAVGGSMIATWVLGVEMPQRKASPICDQTPAMLAVRAGPGVLGGEPGLGPVVRTRTDAPSSATSTVPSVSVR